LDCGLRILDLRKQRYALPDFKGLILQNPNSKIQNQNGALMKYISGKYLTLSLLLLLVIPNLSSAEPLSVYVVNYPLKYFAERIGGEHVRVSFPAPSDGDPAYWIPDVDAIGAYQQADVILLNGAGYAKWVQKVSLPRFRMVDTSRQLKDRYLTTESAVTHRHGQSGEHAHEALAFTTWLDFDLAAAQALAVTAALTRSRPRFKADFEAGYLALEKDLMELDHQMKAIVARNPTLPVVVSHPVYDYLAHRYNLNARAVHWEPDQVPTVAQMNELKVLLKGHPAKWMIWESEAVPGAVQALTNIGMGSVVFNPCGNVPESGDFMTVMQANILNLAAIFK